MYCTYSNVGNREHVRTFFRCPIVQGAYSWGFMNCSPRKATSADHFLWFRFLVPSCKNLCMAAWGGLVGYNMWMLQSQTSVICFEHTVCHAYSKLESHFCSFLVKTCMWQKMWIYCANLNMMQLKGIFSSLGMWHAGYKLCTYILCNVSSRHCIKLQTFQTV